MLRLGERLTSAIEARTPVDSARLATSLSAVADAHWARRAGRDDRGLAAAMRAGAILARIAPASRERTRLGLLAAGLLAESGRNDSGLVVLDATPAAPAGDSLEAEAHFWRGRLRVGAGARAESVAEIERALRLHAARLGPAHPRVAEMLLTLATQNLAAGEYDSAQAQLERSRRALERDPDIHARLLGQVYTQRSVLERNRGDLAQSVDWARRALQVTRRAEGDSSLAVARVHSALGLRYLLVNDPASSQREWLQAIPLLVRHVGPKHFVTVNNAVYLANTYVLLGDTTRTLALYDSLEAAIADEPDRHAWNLSFIATQRSEILLARNRRDEARAMAVRAYELVPKGQDARGTARAETFVAMLNAAHGSGDRAWVDSLGGAYERLADSTGLRRNSVHRSVLEARAAAEARVGAYAAAWAHADECDRLGRARLLSDVRALPESQALGLSSRFGTSLETLTWLAVQDPATHAEAAWDHLVRWRGLVRDEMARLRPARAASPAALSRQQEWAAAQRRVAQLLVAGFAEREDASSREALAAARLAAEEAERRYVRDSGRAATPPADSLSLAEVRAALGADEALVSFAVARAGRGFERLVVFVATGASKPVQLVDLGPPAPVRDAVERWRRLLARSPLSGAAEATCRRAGEDVRRRVWDPLAASLAGAARVALVGDEPVTTLPWLALPVGTRGYLAEQSPAIRVLQAERDRLLEPSEVSNGALLAIGDPDFLAAPRADSASAPHDGTALRGGRDGARRSGHWARLPAAAAEVNALALAWRGHGGTALVLTGDEATEAAFKREAPGRLVLHLATHGVVLADTMLAGAPGTRGVGGVMPLAAPSARAARRPAASATAPVVTTPEPTDARFGRRVLLALAGAARRSDASPDENEGWLTVEEVLTLDLRTVDWVVLSACHSGEGTAWPREGALGMGRAFHLAGAHAVIASQWAVEDRSTREWMQALYDARFAGSDHASDAVRAACRAVLAERRRHGRSTHPFYWAAFTASGE